MTTAEMKPIEDAAQSIVATGHGRDMLQTLQRYLESTGWFESVEQVRLVDHDGIEVIATYATPRRSWPTEASITCATRAATAWRATTAPRMAPRSFACLA